MARPTSYSEWQTRLAAGEKFRMRDIPSDVFHLNPAGNDCEGLFQIFIDGNAWPLIDCYCFIMKDHIHKVEHTLKNICEVSDLFFVEIEFVD